MKQFLENPFSNALGLVLIVALAVYGAFGYVTGAFSNGGGDTATLSLAGGSTNFSTVQTGDGSASAPSLSFTSDTDTGWYRIGANDLGLAVGGSNVAEFNSAGLIVSSSVTRTMSIAGSLISTETVRAKTGDFTTTLYAANAVVTGTIQGAGALTVTGAISTQGSIAAVGSITATGNITTAAVLGMGTNTFTGTVHFGTASTVVSGTTVSHGYSSAPTSFVATLGVIEPSTFTQTVYAECGATTCTFYLTQGSVVTLTTVYWFAGQ